MLLIVLSWITITPCGSDSQDHALEGEVARKRDDERRDEQERDERALEGAEHGADERARATIAIRPRILVPAARQLQLGDGDAGDARRCS